MYATETTLMCDSDYNNIKLIVIIIYEQSWRFQERLSTMELVNKFEFVILTFQINLCINAARG
jgi:hypothetical protein